MFWKYLITFLFSASLLSSTCISQETIPSQPIQPLHGQGSSEAKFHAVVRLKIAEGGQGGWLFIPGSPSPSRAPVVIFCHGWGALQPRGYQAWIDHLVRRGNIVLWPNYQDNLRTRPELFLANAIAGVKAGIKMLQSSNGEVQPDMDRIAVIGHSAGGMIAAGIASTATAAGLPPIRAVMPVEPGDSRRGGIASIPLADLRPLSSDVLLLILVGDEDTSVGTFDGERILHESVAIPGTHKALLMLHSDQHGTPELVANHFAPSAMVNADSTLMKQPFRESTNRNNANVGVVDALDFYGTWRLADMLLDAAFGRSNPDSVFADSTKLRFMGVWSDGVPVKPLSQLQ